MLQGKNNVETPAVTRTQTQTHLAWAASVLPLSQMHDMTASQPPINPHDRLILHMYSQLPTFLQTNSGMETLDLRLPEMQRLHYPCLHMHSLLKSSVPKLEKMRNTKSLTN